MDNGQIQVTHEGVPQGGVISPLLANIALHGLESLVKTTIKGAHLVRFADDFVVFHHDREAIFKAQTLIRLWLSSRGLEIRADKTRIVHTLNGGDEYPTGFDFLGCHVRQYRTRRRSINKSQRPYKTLIKPSKASLKRLVTKLGEIIKRHRGCSQEALITALNPIIVGWANYHRSNVASRVFAYLDSVLYWQLRRWARRRHPNQNRKWVRARYWHTVGRRHWVFGVKQAGEVTLKLAKFSDMSIRRHVKVRGHKSWYRRRLGVLGSATGEASDDSHSRGYPTQASARAMSYL